jgi:hypothetical protein
MLRKGRLLMLSRNTYTRNYVDVCLKKVELQLSTYRYMVQMAEKQNDTELNSAIDSFEVNFFNHMVLVLDNYFVHRARTIELKDGNPLNEVRMLCDSIMLYDNKMTKETKSMKYDPAKSVLKYKIGDEIKLNEEDFQLLSKAFFSEMERKFVND